MSDSIPGDFAIREDATLESIEDGMRAVINSVKVASATVAIALGRIKLFRLYEDIAPDFKTYVELDRVGFPYHKALNWAIIGENYWKYKDLLEENGIRLSKNMQKVRLLNDDIIQNDPMLWERFKEMTVRVLREYIQKRKDNYNVIVEEVIIGDFSFSTSFLYLNGQKVKGVDLREFRSNVAMGKRAVVLWVDNYREAIKILQSHRLEKCK